MSHHVFAPKPNRILMTADPFGGVWTVALELARVFDLQGIQVALAVMGGPLSTSQREEARTIPNLEIFESSFKLEWMADSWTEVERAGEWLLDLETRLAPDLIHLNGYAHGALAWKAPLVMVGNSCVLSWWKAVKGAVAPSRYHRYRAEVRRGLQAAAVVITPTRTMLNSLVRIYGPVAQGRVIPNGRFSLLLEMGAKEEFVLSAGRLWDEGKNMAALAVVAPTLPWPVFLAGEYVHPEGGRVNLEGPRLLGPISPLQMAFWMSRASIFALPARYEPFGLSILEAALAGCALVLGDIPSLREIWDGAALFVPPNDRAALEAGLLDLIHNSSYRTNLAMRARCHAAALTPKRMAAGYLDAYADVLRAKAFARPSEKFASVCA